MTETSPPESAQPALPQPVASDVDPNDPKVQSAVSFLRNPRVRLTPSAAKVRFLKGKGLTPSQIKAAFDQTGQRMSMEMINDAYTKSGSSPLPPSAMTTGAAPVAYSAALSARSAPPPPPPPRTHTLYPASPMEPEAVPESSWDWRDVVIGTGAAVMAAAGGVKLFQRYSPYELRRKGEPRPTPAHARGAQGRRLPSQRPYGGMSSDTEGDRAFGPIPAIPRDVGGVPLAAPPPPLPQAPAGPDKDEEIKRLEKELADTKAALEEKAKKAAEQAVSVATLRNDKNRLVQRIEKQSQEIETLKETIQKLEKEKAEKEKGEGSGEEKPGVSNGEVEGDSGAGGTVAQEEAFSPNVFGEGAGETVPPEMAGMLPKPETDAAGAAPLSAISPAADPNSGDGDVEPSTPPVNGSA